MRRAAAFLLMTACGRIGFDATSDGGTAGDGDPDAAIPRLSSLTAGNAHTCAIRAGRAVCWGDNSRGQLGDGSGIPRSAPTAVALPAGTVTQIRAGAEHTCAILDAAMYCWGANNSGELGFPGGGEIMQPVLRSLPAQVTSISAGTGFSCAIAAGDVYCWGNDSNGRAGNGIANGMTDVAIIVSMSTPAVTVEAGNDHGCAVSATGTVQCWGHNDAGTLGRGSLSPIVAEDAGPLTILPRVDTIAVGGTHACARIDDRAACWGEGGSGQLGDGLFGSSVTAITPNGADAKVSLIAGSFSSNLADANCAVIDGAVACWGGGDFGRLGTGSTDPAGTPTQVGGLPAAVPVEVALGESHTCATFDDGSTWCWGRGDDGQLGSGQAASSLVPVRVTGT